MPDRAANFHRTLRRRLAKWYLTARRDLPWRAKSGRAVNPYHVLVSEAMLQQTQVATVIPYFERFVAALPDVQALADADEQVVLRLWQGLGYYRRARSLHAAARAIVAEHHGTVPATVSQLLQLPGIGRYTAGAVASIAYDVPAPIVDGNVARVLARVFAIDDLIDRPPARDRLWRLAEQLVPPKGAGDFNQALMELGATVCVPRQPRCLTCPWAKLCAARSQGLAERLPQVSSRRKPAAVVHDIVAIRHGRKHLFEQRPPSGLWANLWQLTTREDERASLKDWLATQLGLSESALDHVGTFKHQMTHRTVTFVVWRATRRHVPRRGTWRLLDDLDDLPLANPQRKAVAMLRSLDQAG